MKVKLYQMNEKTIFYKINFKLKLKIFIKIFLMSKNVEKLFTIYTNLC